MDKNTTRITNMARELSETSRKYIRVNRNSGAMTDIGGEEYEDVRWVIK